MPLVVSMGEIILQDPRTAYALVMGHREPVKAPCVDGISGGRSLPAGGDPALSIRLHLRRLDREREAPRAGRDATGGAQRASLAKVSWYYHEHLAIRLSGTSRHPPIRHILLFLLWTLLQCRLGLFCR